MYKPSILEELVIENEDTNNEVESDQKSSFLSFLFNGLKYEHSSSICRTFTNTFLVIIRECQTKITQKQILKEFFDGIVLNNSESDNFSLKFMDLACLLLQDFCSQREDAKKLLTKEDINEILN